MNRIKNFFQKFSTKKFSLKDIRIISTSIKLFKREHYPTVISEYTKKRVNALRKTNVLDTCAKDKIISKVKFLSVRLSRLNLIEFRLAFIRYILYRFAVVLFFLSIGVVTPKILHLGTWRYMTAYNTFLAQGMAILFLFGLDWVWRWFEKAVILSARVKVLGVMMGVALVALLYSVVVLGLYDRSVSFADYWAAMGLVGIVGFFVILSLSMTVDIFLRWAIDTYASTRMPEGLVVNNVLMLLGVIEQHPDRLADIGFKTSGITRLEYIAITLEKSICAKLRMSDRKSNEWIENVTQRMATSVREKKLWILTPKKIPPNI
jgi:hypothetical protein